MAQIPSIAHPAIYADHIPAPLSQEKSGIFEAETRGVLPACPACRRGKERVRRYRISIPVHIQRTSRRIDTRILWHFDSQIIPSRPGQVLAMRTESLGGSGESRKEIDKVAAPDYPTMRSGSDSELVGDILLCKKFVDRIAAGQERVFLAHTHMNIKK